MWGRQLAILCAVCGVLLMAVPIPVVASKFMDYYNYAMLQRKKLDQMEAGKQRKFTLLPRYSLNSENPLLCRDPESPTPYGHAREPRHVNDVPL